MLARIARSLFFRLDLHRVVRNEVERFGERQENDTAKLEVRLDRLRKEFSSEKSRLSGVERHHMSQRESYKELVEDYRVLAERTRRLEERVAFFGQVRSSDVSLQLAQALVDLNAEYPLDVMASHFRERVDDTELQSEPYPHVVIDNVLPSEFYQRLFDQKPPQGYWRRGQTGRENWTVGEDVAPLTTEAVWRFMDETVAGGLLTPFLVSKFDQYFHEYYRMETSGNGRERSAIECRHTGGRLMLRRPGYRLEPHLDPGRSALTALLYLGTPEDGIEHGTNLFKIDRALPERYKGIYYPEREGAVCKLVKRIPFRANSMLVFGSRVALHGADIPVDAEPSTLERYTYQFYVSVKQSHSED